VLDLKKPSRFFFLLTKPNLNSWLVLGGYVLMIFGLLLVAWLALIFNGGALYPWLVWLTAMFAVASAGYSAFLFAQARGRDFWQSPMLFWHLIVQALGAGCNALRSDVAGHVRLAQSGLDHRPARQSRDDLWRFVYETWRRRVGARR
jgi:formate-dependent nitrite reductase membrane component NrfD